MDIRSIAGNGGVERGPNRADRAERDRAKAPSAPPAQDTAAISPTGRETLAAIEALRERAQREPELRDERVDEVRRKLRAGEMDLPEVYRAVAEKLILRGF